MNYDDKKVQYNLFTKKDVSKHVGHISVPTFNKHIESGLIFPPSHFNTSSVSINPRSYYTMADAMRISIILHGCIRMESIFDLAGTIVNSGLKISPGTILYEHVVKPVIQDSFTEVRKQIIESSSDPVDLSKHLKHI